MLAGSVAGKNLPDGTGAMIGFLVLFLVGICKLFDGAIKWYIRKYNNIEKNINFHFSSFKFLLTIYADPDKADVDRGGVLSAKEAISLGIALLIVTEVPYLIQIFGTAKLSLEEWGSLLLLACIPLLAHELLIQQLMAAIKVP